MVSGCLHAKIQASIHKRTKLNQLINLFGLLMNIPKCGLKVPNGAKIMWNQNVEENQSFETFYR